MRTIVALLAWAAFTGGVLVPTPEPPELDTWRQLGRSRVAVNDLHGMRSESCIATIFGAGPNPTDGGIVLGLDRHLTHSDRGIAHRRAPIGSLAKICYQDECTWAPVIDRGPYGCMVPVGEIRDGQTCRGRVTDGKKWCICAGAYRADESTYRGCVDMAPATAARLQHPGYAKVTVFTER
jgi:hypothetical protein